MNVKLELSQLKTKHQQERNEVIYRRTNERNTLRTAYFKTISHHESVYLKSRRELTAEIKRVSDALWIEANETSAKELEQLKETRQVLASNYENLRHCLKAELKKALATSAYEERNELVTLGLEYTSQHFAILERGREGGNND